MTVRRAAFGKLAWASAPTVLVAGLVAACGGGGGGPTTPQATPTPTPPPPNIVVIMADDLEAQGISRMAKLDNLLQSTPQDVQSARLAQASAQASLDSAQAKLDQLTAGATQADVQAAMSGVASAQATLAPAAAKASAVARPMPLAAPTTMAILWSRLNAGSIMCRKSTSGTVRGKVAWRPT